MDRQIVFKYLPKYVSKIFRLFCKKKYCNNLLQDLYEAKR